MAVVPGSFLLIEEAINELGLAHGNGFIYLLITQNLFIKSTLHA